MISALKQHSLGATEPLHLRLWTSAIITTTVEHKVAADRHRTSTRWQLQKQLFARCLLGSLVRTPKPFSAQN